MRTPSFFSSTILICALATFSDCNNSTKAALLGESCSPSRGCDENLTCSKSVCIEVVAPGDKNSIDSGTQQEQRDSGIVEVLDSGTKVDAGMTVNPDGGTTGSDAGVTCSSACNTPPSACHSLQGRCVAGACQYDFVEGASCDDGNVCTLGDTCHAGACAGTPKVCQTPPGNVCLDSKQLKSFTQIGTCQGGLCVYASNTVTCGNGSCNGGTCNTDPCVTVTCNQAPNSCFSSAGLCAQGSCTYPYANGASCDDGNACTSNDSCASGVCQGIPKTCATPPPNVCENSNVLRVYTNAGSCSVGQCSYSYAFVSCANGCANAQCVSSGWLKMTSNVTVHLVSIWGASSNAVWAGGDSGTLAFYNGAQWQAKASTLVGKVISIHGTSASNVFAMDDLGNFAYFDGTVWTNAGNLAATSSRPTLHGLYTTGIKTALVFRSIVVNNKSVYQLYQYDWNSGSFVGTLLADNLARPDNYPIRFSATSSTSIYVPGGTLWNGSTATLLSGPNSITYPHRYAIFGNTIYGTGFQNGTFALFQYDAANKAWLMVTTGFSGRIHDIYGTAANRIFAVGIGGNDGHILYFDGGGWSDLSLPPGIGVLNAVHPFASGEVFAVGHNGTILKGP